MTSTGRREDIQKSVFRMPNKSRITRRDRNDHCPGDEEKWHGTHTNKPKENGIPLPQKYWNLSKKRDTRGILKRNGGRCTIHSNADSSNTELLFRTTHSANQLSIYGAVSRWCEEMAQWILGQQNELTSKKSVAKENEMLVKNVKSQEVNSLVQTPRSHNRASGNRLRECLQNFETLKKDFQFTRVCEDAAFVRKVCLYWMLRQKLLRGRVTCQ